jgi:hypothetical protein
MHKVQQRRSRVSIYTNCEGDDVGLGGDDDDDDDGEKVGTSGAMNDQIKIDIIICHNLLSIETPRKTILLIISWSESPSWNWTLSGVCSKSLRSADSTFCFSISISNVREWIWSLGPKTCPAF